MRSASSREEKCARCAVAGPRHTAEGGHSYWRTWRASITASVLWPGLCGSAGAYIGGHLPRNSLARAWRGRIRSVSCRNKGCTSRCSWVVCLRLTVLRAPRAVLGSSPYLAAPFVPLESSYLVYMFVVLQSFIPSFAKDHHRRDPSLSWSSLPVAWLRAFSSIAMPPPYAKNPEVRRALRQPHQTMWRTQAPSSPPPWS